MRLSQKIQNLIGESAKENKSEITVPMADAVKIAFALGAYEQIHKIVKDTEECNFTETK